MQFSPSSSIVKDFAPFSFVFIDAPTAHPESSIQGQIIVQGIKGWCLHLANFRGQTIFILLEIILQRKLSGSNYFRIIGHQRKVDAVKEILRLIERPVGSLSQQT